MSIASEFKEFIMRGNVVDLAVGMVVGTAFSGIVKSLVDDVIMPPIGILIGGVDFSNLFITLKDGTPAPEAGYASLAAAKAAGYSERRPVHQHHHQFPDYRRRHFRGSQAVELAEEKRSSGGRSTGRTERRSFAAARNPRLPEQKITV